MKLTAFGAVAKYQVITADYNRTNVTPIGGEFWFETFLASQGGVKAEACQHSAFNNPSSWPGLLWFDSLVRLFCIVIGGLSQFLTNKTNMVSKNWCDFSVEVPR